MLKKLFTVVSLLIAFSMVLAACTPATTVVKETSVVQQTSVVKETQVVQQTSVVKETQIVEVTPTPAPTTRHGGWLDQIIFSVVTSDSAITQIKAGAIDAFAYALSSAQLPAIQEAGLNYAQVLGTYYDIMYNPAVCTDTAVLNPFSDRKIREATNMICMIAISSTRKSIPVVVYRSSSPS